MIAIPVYDNKSSYHSVVLYLSSSTFLIHIFIEIDIELWLGSHRMLLSSYRTGVNCQFAITVKITANKN